MAFFRDIYTDLPIEKLMEYILALEKLVSISSDNTVVRYIVMEPNAVRIEAKIKLMNMVSKSTIRQRDR